MMHGLQACGFGSTGGDQRPTWGARMKAVAPILPSPFRTNVADCEFPKMPGPLAFSSAQFHEAPFQGSRRRHLPAVAARPDGTRAGHVGSSLPGGVARGGVGCGSVRLSLPEDRGSEAHLRLFTARMRLRREEDASTCRHLGAAGALFPTASSRGGAVCVFILKSGRGRGKGLLGTLPVSGRLSLR